MNPHPSFGPIPPDEFRKAEEAPFGEATKIIRKYDPLFGRGITNAKKFSIKVSARIYRTDTATVQIEALDEDQAREIIDKMDWSDFDWKEGWDSEMEDGEIDAVAEIKP